MTARMLRPYDGDDRQRITMDTIVMMATNDDQHIETFL
jgi:hypothetical protein